MIELPFPPASLSGHAKGNSHWGKSTITKHWREKTALVARAAGLRAPPEGDIHVHITFVPPDRRGDRVNFPNRCKPIYDGLADALAVNDSRFVPSFTFCEPEKPGKLIVELRA